LLSEFLDLSVIAEAAKMAGRFISGAFAGTLSATLKDLTAMGPALLGLALGLAMWLLANSSAAAQRGHEGMGVLGPPTRGIPRPLPEPPPLVAPPSTTPMPPVAVPPSVAPTVEQSSGSPGVRSSGGTPK